MLIPLNFFTSCCFTLREVSVSDVMVVISKVYDLIVWVAPFLASSRSQTTNRIPYVLEPGRCFGMSGSCRRLPRTHSGVRNRLDHGIEPLTAFAK